MSTSTTRKITGLMYDKGGQVFNVMHPDFGAKADGSTDDTVAIQAAIDAVNTAGGGIVFFPDGEYITSSTLVMKQDVSLYGTGRFNSRIKGELTSSALVSISDVTDLTSGNRIIRSSIQALGFDNTSSGNSGGIGIDLTQMSNMLVSDVQIQNCEIGLRIRGIAYYNLIQHVTVDASTTGFQVINGANSNTFIGCRANQATSGFIVEATADASPIGNVTDISLISCKVEASAQDGDAFLLQTTTGTIVNVAIIAPRIDVSNSGVTAFNIADSGISNVTIISGFLSGVGTRITDVGVDTIWLNGPDASPRLEAILLAVADFDGGAGEPGILRYNTTGQMFRLRNEGNTTNFNLEAGSIRGITNVRSDNELQLGDGITAPAATAGRAKIFIDTADGDLKIIYGDGTTKTIVVDT